MTRSAPGAKINVLDEIQLVRNKGVHNLSTFPFDPLLARICPSAVIAVTPDGYLLLSFHKAPRCITRRFLFRAHPVFSDTRSLLTTPSLC